MRPRGGVRTKKKQTLVCIKQTSVCFERLQPKRANGALQNALHVGDGHTVIDEGNALRDRTIFRARISFSLSMQPPQWITSR